MIIMKRLSRVKRPVRCTLFPSKMRRVRFELSFSPRGEECAIPRKQWRETVTSSSTRCWAFRSSFPSNPWCCEEKLFRSNVIPAGNASCGEEGWKRSHRGSFVVEMAGECEVDASDPRGIVELASLLRPSETSICQQFVHRVRLGVSEVVGVSEDVGEEDYVFSFAELSLPCGSGAIEGMMHVLSARRAEPLEVSWAGEESVWEEVKRRRWCGLSVGDDDDDDDDGQCSDCLYDESTNQPTNQSTNQSTNQFNDQFNDHHNNNHNDPHTNPHAKNTPELSNAQLLAQLQRLTAGIDTSIESMKLRDDSVEPDIETFRCNARGNLSRRVCSQRGMGGVSAENEGGNSGRRETPDSLQCDCSGRFTQRMR